MKFMRAICLMLCLGCSVGCSAGRVPNIKAHAKEALDRVGFKIVGYQGYEWTSFGRWGGMVWYQVVRKDDESRRLYELGLTQWGDEYHIYNLRCLEAIDSSR